MFSHRYYALQDQISVTTNLKSLKNYNARPTSLSMTLCISIDATNYGIWSLKLYRYIKQAYLVGLEIHGCWSGTCIFVPLATLVTELLPRPILPFFNPMKAPPLYSSIMFFGPHTEAFPIDRNVAGKAGEAAGN